ncbi:unnamed protein product, partial [Choristocarpus tenellus]
SRAILHTHYEDRFCSRETPHVLRRGNLPGGGEITRQAIDELRRQLKITDTGLGELNARVRGDVAWVQGHIPQARIPGRTRSLCHRWGAEKVAELTRSWELRALGKALLMWVRCHQHELSEEAVRRFLKVRGAAKARRLLEGW